MKRGALLVFLAMVLVLALPAQRFWEGSVAAGRYGDFPPEGYYGNSNLFPRNSIIEVLSLDTGKSVRLIITGELSHPSLFLMVSEKAAQALGMAGRDTAQVRVSLLISPETPIQDPGFDLPYSLDPDVNPAAAAGDVNYLVDKRGYREETLGREGPGKTEVPGAVEVVGDIGKVQKEPLLNGAPETFPAYSSEREPVYNGPATPVVPPDEPEIFVTAVVERETPEQLEKPRLPSEEPELSPDARRAAVEKLDSIVATIPESLLEEQDSMAQAFPDEPDVGETPELALIEEPSPPDRSEIQGQPPTERTEEARETDPWLAWARSHLPLSTRLVSQSYYLQVATYSDPRGAHYLVELLGETYPVVVEPLQGEKALYRVLVGPVSDDERGVALHNLRAEGFRDAFSRRID